MISLIKCPCWKWGVAILTSLRTVFLDTEWRSSLTLQTARVVAAAWQTASPTCPAATAARSREPQRESELLCVELVGQRLTTLTHWLYPASSCPFSWERARIPACSGQEAEKHGASQMRTHWCGCVFYLYELVFLLFDLYRFILFFETLTTRHTSAG